MSDILHIENGESGLSSRTKINEVIDRTNDLIGISQERYLLLNPDEHIVEGKRYQTYEECVTYIYSLGETLSMLRRWVVKVSPAIQLLVEIHLEPWIHIVGEAGGIGAIRAVVTTKEPSVSYTPTEIASLKDRGYRASYLTILTCDSHYEGSTLRMHDCNVINQTATTGTGQVLLDSCTLEIRPDTTIGADMSSLLYIGLSGGTSAVIGKFTTLTLWGNATLRTGTGSPSGGTLYSRGGGGVVMLDADLSIQGAYFQGNEFHANPNTVVRKLEFTWYAVITGTDFFGIDVVANGNTGWPVYISNSVLDSSSQARSEAGGLLEVINTSYLYAPHRGMSVDMQSALGGLGLAKLTTTAANALTDVSDGVLIYNTTNNALWIRISGTWQEVTTAAPATP